MREELDSNSSFRLELEGIVRAKSYDNSKIGFNQKWAAGAVAAYKLTSCLLDS